MSIWLMFFCRMYLLIFYIVPQLQEYINPLVAISKQIFEDRIIIKFNIDKFNLKDVSHD